MAQPANMVYLVNQFALNDGSADVEIAEFGIYGVLSWDPGTDADWQTALGLLAAASLATWKTDVTPDHYSPAVRQAQAIATQQDASGHAVNEGREVPSGSPWEGTASVSMPWEVSVCINLYGYPRGTFTPNSRRKRGRIYLPPLGTVAISNDLAGKMGSSTVTDLMGDVGTWLSDLATTDLGASMHRWEPRIMSKAAGIDYQIVQLSTDDRFDSQRRRERQQPVVIFSENWP